MRKEYADKNFMFKDFDKEAFTTFCAYGVLSHLLIRYY